MNDPHDEDNGTVKLTVRIDPDLRRELRIEIAKQGTTLQAFVAAALMEKLGR